MSLTHHSVTSLLANSDLCLTVVVTNKATECSQQIWWRLAVYGTNQQLLFSCARAQLVQLL